MSTRSQIKLKKDGGFPEYVDTEIYIYKHSDGYPSGVLPILVPFVEYFHKTRGADNGTYLLAQIVREFAVNDFKESLSRAEIESPDEVKARERFRKTLGWGIDLAKHGDIDYLYEIDADGNIYVNGKVLTEKAKKKWHETELYD
ncbi:MAG: hypothetical protein ACO2ZP_04945 [Bacteriovoracaceae bacterium]